MLSPVVHFALSSVGSVVHYSAKGIWYLAKRAIWGPQKTPEEKIDEKLDIIERRENELLQRQTAFEEEQHKIIQALETILEQQRVEHVEHIEHVKHVEHV